MTTTPRRTRRRLTVESSHDLHRNPYTDIYMAMQWAHVHHLTCEKCRNRKPRKPRPAPYPAEWAENYNVTEAA